MLIIFVDAELIKNGTSYLVSNNKLTGTSLEVLSFVVGGIQQNQTFNDSIDGRSRLFAGSEDKFRRITLTVEMNAEYVQRIAHLRDSINELFSGEFILREKRVKSIEVEYESPGQKTGGLQIGDAEYVNGKQILVTKVNAIEIDDTLLKSTFTVEFETTDLPYFETIYTTKELNDTGYDAMVGKYGLVDDIHIDRTQYTFEGIRFNRNLLPSPYNYRKLSGDYTTQILENGLTKGTYTISFEYVLNSAPNGVTNFLLYAGGIVVHIELDSYIEEGSSRIYGTFTITDAQSGKALVLYGGTNAAQSLENDISFNDVKIESGGIPTPFDIPNNIPNNKFSVWNAGNVTIEPENMYLYITLGLVTTDGLLKLTNKTTGETFEFRKKVEGRNIYLDGMNIMEGTAINALRNTNRQRIKLVPGKNDFEIVGAVFSQITVNTRFYYK